MDDGLDSKPCTKRTNLFVWRVGSFVGPTYSVARFQSTRSPFRRDQGGMQALHCYGNATLLMFEFSVAEDGGGAGVVMQPQPNEQSHTYGLCLSAACYIRVQIPEC